ASVRCLAVPPVERISMSLATSARARSMMPLLSETERMARSIRIRCAAAAAAHHRCRAYVAACFLPDEVVEVHEVGDGVRVADRGDAEGGGAVVELGGGPQRTAAEVLLAHQRIEAARAGERLVEVARHPELRIEPVEDGREPGHAALE